MSTEPNILEVEGLKIHFGRAKGLLRPWMTFPFLLLAERLLRWSAKAAVAKA